jgi:hypothetical protein
MSSPERMAAAASVSFRRRTYSIGLDPVAVLKIQRKCERE